MHDEPAHPPPGTPVAREARIEDRSTEPTARAIDPLDGGAIPLQPPRAAAVSPGTVLDPTIDDQIGAVLRDGAPPGSGTVGGIGASAMRADPWEHRRGEPRLFAILWMLYVIAAVLGSVEWVTRSVDLSASAYSPAARIMLAVVAAGALVLWPMTRLSQAAPRGEGGVPASVLGDVIVVVVPIWMVTWPMRILAAWPLDIVAALSVMLAAWVYFVGGLLVFALRGSTGRRAIWMGAILVLVTGGAALWGALEARAMTGAEHSARWLSMFSPFSAIPVLTGHGFSGPDTPVDRWQWLVILGTCAAGILCWIFAGVRSMNGSGGRVGAAG